MKTLLCAMTAVALTTSVAVAEEAPNNEMFALTQGVLAGITGGTQPTSEEDKIDISVLVTQAMEQGQSDDYLDALINQAAADGRIEVPEAMVSTDGEVDTRTLIASLVEKSTTNKEDEEALVAEAIGGGFSNRSEPVRHTVVSGESLAGIALTYYQDAGQYKRIFEANRDTIERANLIRVGQVILIP